MDILGPLPETERGYCYILVISDYATRRKEAFAKQNMEAAPIAKCLEKEVIYCFGVPDLPCYRSREKFESVLVRKINFVNC